MLVTWKTLATAALCAGIACEMSLAQTVPATILEIDVENRVNYITDTADISKNATNANLTPAVTSNNFRKLLQLGDIVAVNGKPVKGTQVLNGQTIIMSRTPAPGQAISDTAEQLSFYYTFQILQVDGTPIGSITVVGLGGGDIPPGSPSGSLQGDAVVVGGTGAFLGARGQSVVGQMPSATRNASITEDPANRRRNGGGAARTILKLIPLSRPEVLNTPAGPAVTHSSDFSLVSASKPAVAGEMLSLFATGLGPTRSVLDPGQPFPSNPLAAVNSPVEVTVNGKPAQVLAAVGFPGSVDGYQVNFQVPPDTTKGVATVQVSAAWIAGPEVKIAVQ